MSPYKSDEKWYLNPVTRFCPFCTRTARDAEGNALMTRNRHRELPCTDPQCIRERSK